jgi:hypothetical protein
MQIQHMEELSINEINAVAGGDLPTIVAFGTGLAASVAIGTALGPPGMAVASIGFTASFFGTALFQRWFNRA